MKTPEKVLDPGSCFIIKIGGRLESSVWRDPCLGLMSQELFSIFPESSPKQTSWLQDPYCRLVTTKKSLLIWSLLSMLSPLLIFNNTKKKKKEPTWAINTNIMYVWMCVLSIYCVYYLILENNPLLNIDLFFNTSICEWWNRIRIINYNHIPKQCSKLRSFLSRASARNAKEI